MSMKPEVGWNFCLESLKQDRTSTFLNARSQKQMNASTESLFTTLLYPQEPHPTSLWVTSCWSWESRVESMIMLFFWFDSRLQSKFWQKSASPLAAKSCPFINSQHLILILSWTQWCWPAFEQRLSCCGNSTKMHFVWMDMSIYNPMLLLVLPSARQMMQVYILHQINQTCKHECLQYAILLFLRWPQSTYDLPNPYHPNPYQYIWARRLFWKHFQLECSTPNLGSIVSFITPWLFNSNTYMTHMATIAIQMIADKILHSLKKGAKQKMQILFAMSWLKLRPLTARFQCPLICKHSKFC